MAAFNYMFLPKLYKEYGDGPPTVIIPFNLIITKNVKPFFFEQKFYEPGGLEKWGDQIISTVSKTYVH